MQHSVLSASVAHLDRSHINEPERNICSLKLARHNARRNGSGTATLIPKKTVTNFPRKVYVPPPHLRSCCMLL